MVAVASVIVAAVEEDTASVVIGAFFDAPVVRPPEQPLVTAMPTSNKRREALPKYVHAPDKHVPSAPSPANAGPELPSRCHSPGEIRSWTFRELAKPATHPDLGYCPSVPGFLLHAV